MTIKNKGFFSLCLLLFISLFLGVVINTKKENYYSLLSIKLLDTKKQSATINFEEYIKYELKNNSNDPKKLAQIINQKLNTYLNNTTDENWFIIDLKNNQKETVTVEELQLISKVIVLKPAPNIILKRYTLTNGIEKNKCLSFELSTNSSKTTFSFPKNYSVEVIVYS